MSDYPERVVTFSVPLPHHGQIPFSVVPLIVAAVAEAQLLEDALKTAIRLDVDAFGSDEEVPDLLAALKNITLGGTIKVADGTADRSELQRTLSALVGFSQFFQALASETKDQIAARFSDALDRRNRLAHAYLVQIIKGQVSEAEAASFLTTSRDAFAALKSLVIQADFTSGKMGAVAPDGSSLPRMPKLPQNENPRSGKAKKE